MLSKNCIITGGSRGIGKAITKVFCEQQYKVIVVAQNLEKLKKVQQEFFEQGFELAIYQCDISNSESVKETIAKIGETFQTIEVLINNAGISNLTLLETENTFDVWNKQLAVNLSGTYYFSKEVFKLMKNNNQGSIINIASVYGLIGGEGYSAYCASKHGVIGLTKSMALEMAKYKITVNAICPGWVETDMFEHDMEELAQAYNIEKEFLIEDEKLAVPTKKFTTGAEVGNLALYLASEYATNITGNAINISGGLAV